MSFARNGREKNSRNDYTSNIVGIPWSPLASETKRPRRMMTKLGDCLHTVTGVFREITPEITHWNAKYRACLEKKPTTYT